MTDKYVFLDRDGVINKDSSLYIKNPSEFEFLPKSIEAVAMLCENGFKVIVITNQSLIGRGMASVETLSAIFEKMKKGIAEKGGQILDIFFCPHRPDEGCACRKPAPGMIWDAQKKYHIDLSRSVMVGDSAKDIQAGIAAGCGKTVLVETGNGPEARTWLAEHGIEPDRVAADLFQAAEWIVCQSF